MKDIEITLSSQSIEAAIRELNEYKRALNRKIEIFRKRVAEELADMAKGLFNQAQETIVNGGNGDLAPVNIEVDNSTEDLSVIIATGEDVVFIEFGTGVYHNGTAGESPHPKGKDFNYLIGGYGKGYGKRQAWGYKDGSGNLIVTRGIEAMLPMYNAAQACAEVAENIAREVFAGD